MSKDPFEQAHDDAHGLNEALLVALGAWVNRNPDASLAAVLHGTEMTASILRRVAIATHVPKPMVEDIRRQASECARNVYNHSVRVASLESFTKPVSKADEDKAAKMAADFIEKIRTDN